jgi:hypothetical protein
MIRYLAGAGAGLSLLSVSTSSLPLSIIQGLMLDAARPTDIVGALIDGSIGALTVRPRAEGGESALEQDFLDRLRPPMSALCERRSGGRVTLWLRAVHRPAADITQAPDLIGCLFDAPATPLTLKAGAPASAWENPPLLFPRVSGPVDPFIEPVERQPALLRMFSNRTLWPQRPD